MGLMRSAEDALRQWDSTPEEGFPRIQSAVFSGTAMLNRLLTRKGRRVGVLVTAGQEDSLQMERGIQTYLGFSYADRLHIATHHHNEPLVPRDRVHGVRGRIDLFGDEVLPLREEDAREAVNALLDDGVEGIVHLAALLATATPPTSSACGRSSRRRRPSAASTATCPVFVSSELYPSRRDFPRLNTTVIEAYAAEPSRGTLRAVRDRTKERGAGFELRVMASHGGTISIDADQLATTLVSGPIGGVVGARWLADRIGLNNVLCTDIGGTSFDIALLDRQALRGDDDAGHGEIPAQHAARADRLGRRRLRLLRPHRPQRPPPRGRPRLGRRDDRHRLARGRRGDGLDHRPQPGPRPAQPRVLPRRPGAARHRARPPRGRAPGRRRRSASASRRRPPA